MSLKPNAASAMSLQFPYSVFRRKVDTWRKTNVDTKINVVRELQNSCACRKLNADILVVRPAENWVAKNLPGPFDGTRERRILPRRDVCGCHYIIHVRQQQVAEVAFAEHNDVVEAFPSDRTDQRFGVPVLPW